MTDKIRDSELTAVSSIANQLMEDEARADDKPNVAFLHPSRFGKLFD